MILATIIYTLNSPAKPVTIKPDAYLPRLESLVSICGNIAERGSAEAIAPWRLLLNRVRFLNENGQMG